MIFVCPSNWMVMKAFTTIELIFVIVIVGVLASIAIPKLSVTRSDSQGAVVAHALAACINDAGNEYMKNGSFHHFTQDDNATSACRYASECFVFIEDDANGSLKVINNTATSKKCEEAQRIAQRNLLVGTTTIHF